MSPEMEARLRKSIETFGIYKPIITRETDDGAHEILGGEHRWMMARDMGYTEVPVVCLGKIDDKQAKLIGLADNGQYGVDDVTRLSSVLRDIGVEDVAAMLPYTDNELNEMFKNMDEIDLSKIGFDEDIEIEPVDSLPADRPAKTTELMRFKVPVEDREMVEKLLKKIVTANGYDKEDDSLLAAGMALVDLAREGKAIFEA